MYKAHTVWLYFCSRSLLHTRVIRSAAHPSCFLLTLKESSRENKRLSPRGVGQQRPYLYISCMWFVAALCSPALWSERSFPAIFAFVNITPRLCFYRTSVTCNYKVRPYHTSVHDWHGRKNIFCDDIGFFGITQQGFADFISAWIATHNWVCNRQLL